MIIIVKRWNDLWLNEGFARYMEYVGTDFVKNGWEMVRFLNIITKFSIGSSCIA